MGLRKITPIRRPQKLPDTAPIAVVLTSWFSFTGPASVFTAITASLIVMRYSFCSLNRRCRTSSAFASDG